MKSLEQIKAITATIVFAYDGVKDDYDHSRAVKAVWRNGMYGLLETKEERAAAIALLTAHKYGWNIHECGIIRRIVIIASSTMAYLFG